MKKRMKRFLTYSVYRKAVLLYAVSIVLLTAVIVMSLFGMVAYQVKETATENSKILLGQLVGTSEYIKTDVGTLLSVVANRTSTQKFIRVKEEDKLLNYHLFQDLSELKSSYSYVVDLSVVSLDKNLSVQATGTNINDNYNSDFVSGAMQTGRVIIPRKIVLNNPNRAYSVISFLYFLPYANSAVVVDVNADRFKLSIGKKGENAREAAIINTAGEQVAFPEQSPISELDTPYLTAIIMEQEAGTTQFVYDDSDHKRILSFSKSAELNWWFVDGQSYSRFYSTYQRISIFFVSVALGFLALCILLSVGFSRRVSKPLKQLVERCKTGFETDFESGDELNYLDKAIAKVEHERYVSDQYLRAQFLQSRLQGKDMPFFVSKENQETLRLSYESPCYCVLLLQLQPLYPVNEEHLAREMSLLRFTVCNLAGDIFGAEYHCEPVDMGDDLTAVLLFLQKKELDESYLFCFQNLKKFAEREVRVQISGSVGSVVDSFSDLQYSAAKAKQYLSIGGIMGKGELIDSNHTISAGYQEKNQRLVESVIEYTRENYSNTELSLKSISQKFGLSTTYLGKIFKAVQGQSYATFVTNCRLEQSRLALLETTKTVSEIAAEVGFANSTYFATVFKNSYGITPTAFRNNNK